MADQKINALPVKTAPTTGDKMLMIGAAEEYQIDYDQLATAILNKLTSKTYALNQGTKTLIAALNELNSKFTMNSNETIDCNETTKFLVFCNNDSENLPLTSYGTLMTLVRDQNIRVQLFWSSTSENRMYTRIKSVTGWGAWYLLQLQ